MNTIYVYGDSFAANYVSGAKGWCLDLGKKLRYHVYNQAIAGSSTEYAMKRFTDDVQKNIFKLNDMIIFVTSTPGRFHFQYQCDSPGTAAKFWNPVDPSDPDYRWYKDNKAHIEWTMINMDIHMAAINHECYLHALKDFARSRPDCNVVVLANSDHHAGIPSKIPFGDVPENFIRPNIFLQVVSENEYDGFNTYNEFVQHTKWDPRINHLSEKNGRILVDMIVRAIDTKNVNHFKYDAFESKIFKPIANIEQYMKYVTNGKLCLRRDIEQNLAKNLS